jgi:accessory gene regulator B
MFSKLSKKAVNALIGTSVISDEEQELYIYGFYMLFSYLFYFIFAVLLGVLFHLLLESVLFFLLFSLIRSYAGGVHASKELFCVLYTSLSFLVSIAFIRLNAFLARPVVAFIVLVAASLSILIFAPLDTYEKQLNHEEKQYYQKVSYLILVVIVILAVIAYLLRGYSIFYACSASLGLEGALLLIGHLKVDSFYRNANSS